MPQQGRDSSGGETASILAADLHEFAGKVMHGDQFPDRVVFTVAMSGVWAGRVLPVLPVSYLVSYLNQPKTRRNPPFVLVSHLSYLKSAQMPAWLSGGVQGPPRSGSFATSCATDT